MTIHENAPRSQPIERHATATPKLLTVEEAAERMGTPPRFVRRLIAERRIRFCRVGRYVRLADDDVVEFIDAGWVEAESRSHRSRRR